MLKRFNLNRPFAILILCLFLLPVTVQMAHTHPLLDRDHRDCPACVFNTTIQGFVFTGPLFLILFLLTCSFAPSPGEIPSIKSTYSPRILRAPPTR
jgi:hypothetical protein